MDDSSRSMAVTSTMSSPAPGSTQPTSTPITESTHTPPIAPPQVPPTDANATARELVADVTGTQGEGKKRMKGKKKSDVWYHFERVDLDWATCNYCHNSFAAHVVRNGTSGMKNHLERCPDNPHRLKKGQSTLSFPPPRPVSKQKKSSEFPRRVPMFSIRVHSVDTNHLLSEEEEEWTTTTTSTTANSVSIHFTNPNFDIQQRKGIIHLYRNNNISSSYSSSSNPINSNNRDTNIFSSNSKETSLLFVLVVPNHLSIYDFIHFCGSYIDHLSEILIIRNDVLEDRYSLLIKLVDQEKTDSFRRNFNGRPFSSTEAEICHILSIVSVEYTELTEIANTPPPGFTELPTCPVCLERLDQDTSGILTTVCDHSFQCPCISRWADSSCPVCRFCQQQTAKPTCVVCATQEDLWICLICGFVGCGRYKGRHAIRHWEDTKHCYSLDVEAQRVWDYVGDTYVHRLNQSKTDGKMVDLNSRCMSVDGDCGPCSTCECSDDSGINGVVFGDKVETIVDEYNHLLASQLENQREYYEALLAETKGKRGKFVLDEVEKAVNLKLQEAQQKIEKCLEEKTAVASRNENLMKNQDNWRKTVMELEERERLSLASRDEKILDLEEQIRDLTVYIEAQKTLAKMTDSDGIKGGTVLPVPLQQQSSVPNTKRRSKTNKRR